MIEKAAYILSVLIGIIVANSCTYFCPSQDFSKAPATAEANNAPADSKYRNYGSYLAGWVAHLRHDLNKAADYYKRSIPYVPKEKMLPTQLYVMLTSQGRIDEAVKYAQIAREQGDDSPFICTIEAVSLLKNKKFQEAVDVVDDCSNPVSEKFFNPLIAAWGYAGLKEDKKALKALSPLAGDPAFRPLYLFHAGAINDYLGNTKAAEAHYTALMNLRHMELSVFSLQVIANFYLREQEPDKALRAASLAINKDNLMMKTVIDEIKKADSSIPPFLENPNVGLADALFSIALLLQQNSGNAEIAILFASLAYYCSPEYPLPQLLIASLLEKRELYTEANEAYARVPKDSYAYYTALFHTAKNLFRLGKTREAEKIFKNLYLNYPPNPDILTNLGEVARINGRFREAADFYLQAVECYPDEDLTDVWPLYFAIGISHSAAGDNGKAEEYLRKVLKIRPNKFTQNHLGYILLLQNKNLEEAFELIVSAYNPVTDDGTVTDSIGWAFYKIGNYEKAVEYLEKASSMAPSEAVIYDHLGDAYWQIGRKREARFQWNHALNLKDDTGEFNRRKTEEKIKNGLKRPQIPAVDQNKIDAQTARLEKKEKNKLRLFRRK